VTIPPGPVLRAPWPGWRTARERFDRLGLWEASLWLSRPDVDSGDHLFYLDLKQEKWEMKP
jgi:hypothetical protein